jgi:TetR/AcrR family transcriptional repressor of nem operon
MLLYQPVGIVIMQKFPLEGTRTKLLAAAQQLMLEKGYAATSVNEICEIAGVTKGSFFHFFDSKETLGKEVLYYYWGPIKAAHEQGDFLQADDPLERLFRYCDFITELVEHPMTPKSCLFGNFTQELSTTYPEIIVICQEAFTWWTELLEQDLIKAKEKYTPVQDFDPKSVAQHFMAVYEGNLILFKAYHDPTLLRTQLRHFKEYLALLFGRS